MLLCQPKMSTFIFANGLVSLPFFVCSSSCTIITSSFSFVFCLSPSSAVSVFLCFFAFFSLSVLLHTPIPLLFSLSYLFSFINPCVSLSLYIFCRFFHWPLSTIRITWLTMAFQTHSPPHLSAPFPSKLKFQGFFICMTSNKLTQSKQPTCPRKPVLPNLTKFARLCMIKKILIFIILI